MKYFFLITCLVLATNTTLSAQNRCGTSVFEQYQQLKNPALKQQRNAFEHQLKSYTNRSAKKLQNEIITIPVVFHVLHQNDEEDENVTVSKLTSQIDVLNEDFRRKNDDTTSAWTQAADAKIRFSLANVDINGNYFNGVTRTLTNIDVFEYQTDSLFLDAKGGKNIWPGYLNIYVCDLGADYGGPAGFSSLPGYPTYIDGVALHYEATGLDYPLLYPYLEGRLATHEVGHWLNLQHLWGPTENEADYSCDQDDGVADTPNSFAPYFGCDTGSSCGNEDMAENFMDYHDDSCINLFTQGQAERMHASIDQAPSRRFLINPCHENATKQTIKYKLRAESEKVQAIDTVYALNQITDNAEVMYKAGQIVMLENGFTVDESSNFLAEIKVCTGN